MNIDKLIVGESATNCYILSKNDFCIVIDPGGDPEYISEFILRKNLNPEGVLITHGHFDHLGAAIDLKLNFSVPIYLNKNDEFLLKRAAATARYFSNMNFPNFKEDVGLKEGEIKFHNISVKTIFTPGHTPGSTCFYSENNLFVGDLVFADGEVGELRSYSQKDDLKKSLQKLKNLPYETYLWPGHGEGNYLSQALEKIKV